MCVYRLCASAANERPPFQPSACVSRLEALVSALPWIPQSSHSESGRATPAPREQNGCGRDRYCPDPGSTRTLVPAGIALSISAGSKKSLGSDSRETVSQTEKLKCTS